MDLAIQPLQERIRKIGTLLWIFAIGWLAFNLIGLLVVVATVVGFGIAGRSGNQDAIINMFTRPDLVPGVSGEALETILAWDFENYLEHFWLTLFLALVMTIYFVVTMVLILKIARAMKQGDILSHPAIRSMHILGWLYLIHGIVGFLGGTVIQLIAYSNTAEILFFSFVRDACLYSFSFSGSGIEWGLLVLAISSILKHARLMRDEQLLVV